MTEVPPIDWSVHDKYPPDEVACRCGRIYYSHVKARAVEGVFDIWTRLPCPACGKDHGHVRRASSPPEREIIG